MTKEEKRQIEYITYMASVANIRNADPRELLAAFVSDTNKIKEGKEPTEVTELI